MISSEGQVPGGEGLPLQPTWPDFVREEPLKKVRDWKAVRAALGHQIVTVCVTRWQISGQIDWQEFIIADP